MLAQLERPTADFHALARYLILGREQPPHPERVAWLFTRNLPTDDPMRVASLMSATAKLSKRCTKPCYHAIIAWAHDEKPSPEIMQDIARRVLDAAGLAEHQALVVGHGDKAHAHLHMMINRVHPTTGRAWSTAHDYRRFDRIMKDLSEEYGFQYVPAHVFEPELTDDRPKKPNSKATWAAKRGADTHRRQWSRQGARRYGAAISDKLGRVSTWDDAEQAFADDGLIVEAKGTGFVVGDADSYAKLSALGLATHVDGLIKARGATRSGQSKSYRRSSRSNRSAASRPSKPPPSRPIWTVDAVDIARVIGDKQDVQAAIQTAVGQRKARMAKRSLIEQLMDELKEQLKASTSLKPAKVRTRPRARMSTVKQDQPSRQLRSAR